jgi:hypothetical protein
MSAARWAVASVSVVSLLFAPATDEVPPGSSAGPRRSDDPRILAPTVRDAFVAVRPKLTSFSLGTTEPRYPGGSLPPAAVPAAAVLLVWASITAGLRSGTGPRPLFLRGLSPRGPPGLQAV